jgi:hypothetical protein
MKQPQPGLPKPETDAFLASGIAWLGWFLAIILKLGAPRRSRTLRRWIEKLERFVEHVIFLMAVQRLAPLPRPYRQAPPRHIPAGFRRATRSWRFVFKLARIRARRKSWPQRVERLISALANPERYIARFLKRLRTPRLFSLVAAAPPAHACARLATCEPALADSS